MGTRASPIKLRRALQGAYLQFIEGVARSGADRVSRLKCSRAEACEAAGCIEAIEALGLAKHEHAEHLLELLWRACAMLTQLHGVIPTDGRVRSQDRPNSGARSARR